jgi:hypothetical protein
MFILRYGRGEGKEDRRRGERGEGKEDRRRGEREGSREGKKMREGRSRDPRSTDVLRNFQKFKV